MDGRPNLGNKAAFSNSSGVVWTGPQSLLIQRNNEYFILTLARIV